MLCDRLEHVNPSRSRGIDKRAKSRNGRKSPDPLSRAILATFRLIVICFEPAQVLLASAPDSSIQLSTTTALHFEPNSRPGKAFVKLATSLFPRIARFPIGPQAHSPMSEPLPITSAAPRRRSPSRQGRLGTVSPSNSFDPAFAPPSRHTSLLSPDSPDISLSSTPPEERRTVCAQEVSKRLRTLSSMNPSKPLEILHLPPLLSLLPSNLPLPEPIPSDVAYTSSSLPTITPLSLSLHRALHQLRPITSNYAIAPYADSFNWSDLELEDLTEGQITREREWYIVAFRSKRRKGFSEEERKRLYSADREAHEEAIQVS